MRFDYEQRPSDYTPHSLFQLRWMLAGLAALWAVAPYLPLDERWRTIARSCALTGLPIIPFALVYHYFILRWTCGLPMRQTVEVGEAGLRIENPRGETTLRWGSMGRVEERFGAVVVFTGRQFACLVPARAFASEDERVRFAAELRSRAGKPSGA